EGIEKSAGTIVRDGFLVRHPVHRANEAQPRWMRGTRGLRILTVVVRLQRERARAMSLDIVAIVVTKGLASTGSSEEGPQYVLRLELVGDRTSRWQLQSACFELVERVRDVRVA